MDKGLFVTFEGIDGSGKTTLAGILRSYLERKGICVSYVPSVGYEPVGHITEQLLRDKSLYDPYAHLFLSYANNRILVKSVIEPEISCGKFVIVERYYHSTIAYSLPLGIPLDWMLQISSVLIEPDLIVYCDVPVEIALDRKRRGDIENIETGFMSEQSPPDAFVNYQTKVKQAYQQLIGRAPDRYLILPCEKPVQEVAEIMFHKVQRFLSGERHDDK